MSSPEDQLKALERTSTRLGDIEADLTSYALDVGFKSIEKHQYILSNASNLVVMAARPGNGKTALSTQIAMHVAKKHRVLMFSLEMSKEALYKRMISVHSGVPIKMLNAAVHRDRVEAAKSELKEYKLDIIDIAELDINQIIAKAFDENRYERLELIVIDYAGLIKVNPSENRAQSIGQAAKLLKKRLSDHLQIPVLLLAQMNRSFDDQCSQFMQAALKSRMYANAPETPPMTLRPTMADIADSADIERAADVVMFLQRPHAYDPDQPESLFKVFVTKNRNGGLEDFELEFNGPLTKFNDKYREEL